MSNNHLDGYVIPLTEYGKENTAFWSSNFKENDNLNSYQIVKGQLPKDKICYGENLEEEF